LSLRTGVGRAVNGQWEARLYLSTGTWSAVECVLAVVCNSTQTIPDTSVDIWAAGPALEKLLPLKRRSCSRNRGDPGIKADRPGSLIERTGGFRP